MLSAVSLGAAHTGREGTRGLAPPPPAHVPLSPRPARSGELPSPSGPEVRTRLVLPTGSRSWFRRHLQRWPRCPEGAEVGRTRQGCSPSHTPTCQWGTWGTPTPANLSNWHFLSQPPSAQGALCVSSGAWRPHYNELSEPSASASSSVTLPAVCLLPRVAPGKVTALG